MNTPELHTERLRLRRFREHDASDMEAFFRIYSDVETNTFLPWFPVRNMDEARAMFQERYAAVYEKEQGYAYAICLKDDNVPVGYMHASMEDNHDLGYGLLSSFWNKGLATEAGRALLARLKEDGVPYVTATYDTNNPGSGRVMQKLGMSYQYSYEELWQPKNFPATFRMYQLNLSADKDFVYRRYWEESSVHFVEKA